jgi:NAD(P)-dependent dehydrogenase (short-subunit alcohol dehydrogenase family)
MKPGQQHAVTFRQPDLELFTKISHDRNPAHVDAHYARRTPFGQCLVYGVLGALGAIREPLKGSPLRLKKLSATFKRPLFIDVPYAVRIDIPSHGQLAISVSRGGVEKLSLEVDYEVGGEPWTADGTSVGYAERSAPMALEPSELQGREFAGEYELATAFLGEFKKQFGFQYAFIPALQLTALVWTSYLVGMEVPGKQALFLACSMDFAPPTGLDQRRLRYAGRVTRHSAETSTLTIAADISSPAGPVATVHMEAAQRPPAVERLLAALEECVGRSNALEGKLALVSGSSRGLGSLLALGFALHGADVILNCRDGREEVDRVAGQVASIGRRATIVQGDLQEHGTWVGMLEAIGARGLDIFVNNAFPPVVPMTFAELSDDVVERFLRIVRATTMGMQLLMPAVAKNGGVMVNISSEYTQTPPREFAHYVLAKSAMEGLFLCLAKEYGAVRFVTVRPPRMLTDMTNGLVGAFQGRSPEGVVAAVVRAVAQPAEGANYSVVDNFD